MNEIEWVQVEKRRASVSYFDVSVSDEASAQSLVTFEWRWQKHTAVVETASCQPPKRRVTKQFTNAVD